MSTLTHVEVNPAVKRGPIMVRPYFDPEVGNMGLEKYGLSLHDGVYHEEQLACIEKNGIKRYVTGLNEFAPDVTLIVNDEEREAKIKQIRLIVVELEKALAGNVLKADDPDFWNKVKLLKHDNDEFWGKISIRCGNGAVNLDPAKEPYDLIRIMAIEAGGFSIIARSLEDARSRPSPPKFYLDKYEDTAVTKTELKKLKNKALSELEKMFSKNSKKLMYVAKVLDMNSVQYRKSTPMDVIYDNMDSYINGTSYETNQRRAAISFMETCDQDMETLKIRAIVKDSTYFKFIALKSDGFIYHVESGAMLGRTTTDVLEFLKNPLNDQVLMDLIKKTDQYWNG